MSEINLVNQTVVFAVVLVSMAFRMKGNYLVHGITMAVVVAWGVVIAALGSLNFFNSSYTATLTSPALNLAVFSAHAFFGIATFASAIWLVALWRPHSTTFPTKSKRIAQITTILWVSAYVVGIFVFLVRNTAIFA
jgi:hypothetical protein